MGKGIMGKRQPFRCAVSTAVAVLLFVTPAFALRSLRVEKISSQSSQPALDCRITYPHISGVVNGQNQQLLNVGFAEQAKIFRAKADYAAKSGTVKADMDYRVTRNQDGVLSLVIRRTISAANGVQREFTGVTIDTVSGQRFFLSDLFIDNADYVATLSGQIQQKITQSRMAEKLVRKFDRIGANQAFYLTGDALVVFFSQGEYFSDDCAVTEFAIPLKSLEGILKPQYCISE
jgi:Protein of unknown function (DUF3298).